MLTRLKQLAGSPAAMVAIPVALQLWLWSPLFTTPGYFWHSDLYEEFLPQFLAPLVTWSPAEFAGMPVFADPQNAAWYPIQILSRAIGSWSLYIAAAYLIAAAGSAAYAWELTRSRRAAVLAGIAWPLSEAMADLTPHFAMLHGFAWFPFVLFGLEKIGVTHAPRWVAATAGFIACLALAGHPQVTVYCGYLIGAYALTLWWAGGRDRRVGVSIATAAVLGGMAAAVQLVPTLSLSDWIARSQVGFGHFADGFTKQPHDFMAGIVPQFCHERRETPQYAGVLTLLLACVAVVMSHTWRARFWMVVAVVCLLLGLGSQTPLAAVAYHVPLYDRFRVVARHLALHVFALVALAAIGAAAIGEVRLKGRAMLSALVPAVLALAGLAFVGRRPDLFQVPCSSRFGIDWMWPAGVTHVESQALFVVLATACIMLSGRRHWRRALAIAMPVLLAIDLLNSQAESVNARGLEPWMLPPELTAPSVHAARLRDELAPTHQRLLPLEGSATDAIAPGMFARLWHVPSLGGYNPLLPRRLNKLTRMNNNGSVPPGVLLPDDITLDLFAVRFVTVRASDLQQPQPGRGDAPLDQMPALDVLLGPSDCRARGPMRLTLGVPPAEVAGVILTGFMRCQGNVRDGDRVATVTVSGQDEARTVPVMTGPADGGSGHVWVPRRNEERPALEGFGSRADFRPLRATTVTIETAAQSATLVVDRVAVITTDGHRLPLTLLPAAVTEPRWREWRRFATSRESDRGSDGPGRNEVAYVVLENTRALPRAWFAGTVFELPDAQAMEAIRFGRMRDGTPLTLATSAFVDTGTPIPGSGGAGSVSILSATDGRFALDVATSAAGLVVVSELHHPSWRATIDGKRSGVVRADYALIGVLVEAGRHRVELAFEPTSLLVGQAISLAGLLGMALCVAPLGRPKRCAAAEGT